SSGTAAPAGFSAYAAICVPGGRRRASTSRRSLMVRIFESSSSGMRTRRRSSNQLTSSICATESIPSCEMIEAELTSSSLRLSTSRAASLKSFTTSIILTSPEPAASDVARASDQRPRGVAGREEPRGGGAAARLDELSREVEVACLAPLQLPGRRLGQRPGRHEGDVGDGKLHLVVDLGDDGGAQGREPGLPRLGGDHHLLRGPARPREDDGRALAQSRQIVEEPLDRLR